MTGANPLQKQGRILQFYRGTHVEVAKPPGISTPGISNKASKAHLYHHCLYRVQDFSVKVKFGKEKKDDSAKVLFYRVV
jgi:hypothetical protein